MLVTLNNLELVFPITLDLVSTCFACLSVDVCFCFVTFILRFYPYFRLIALRGEPCKGLVPPAQPFSCVQYAVY